MKTKDWMKKFPIVRFNEISRRLNGKEYAKVFTHRLTKSGYLTRVIKGVYSASDNPFEVASNIYYPSYISCLSASYRFGFSEAIPRVIHIVSQKKHNYIEFKGYSIEFVKLPCVWGYHKEDNEFIADVEKLMIDAFLRPNCMGNFDEIISIFERCEKIDVAKLAGYLKRLNSNKIFRCVGYMLEKYKQIDISNVIPIDKNYHALNPFKVGKKTMNKKWRLRI